MLIIYCIGLFDGCFGFGVWQCWNCRVPFFFGMEKGTPEEGGIGPGVDGVVDAVEVLWGGCGRGTPENGGISPEWMQSWMF